MAKKKKLNPSYLVIGVLGVLALGLGVNAYVGGAPKVVVEGDYVEAPSSGTELGAAAGPEHYVRQYFNAGYQSGGDVHTTSSNASTYTLLAGEVDQDVSYIEWTPNVNLTLTTMASSSMQFLGPNAGDTREYLLYNASSTVGSITFAAGTGVDLQEDEGGSVIVDALELSRVTFLRKSDSDVIVLVEPYQLGD